jgi:hypothetical protein
MGSFSDYLELKLLDHMAGKTSFTMPAVVAIGLCLADPTDAGTGANSSECTATNYARKSIAAADWNSAATGSITNSEDITFVECTNTAGWGKITHFAIYDTAAAGAGNMLAHGALTTSKTIEKGETCKFAAGDLKITLT